MSDQQKTVLSLALVLQTCNAALQSVEPQPVPEPLDVLHKDLISLLSLLYAATTKVSLALKPSSPTYSASLSPLKDLADHVSALFHCANHFVPDTHGATLVQEVTSLVKDAIDSIRALVQKFLEIEANDSRQDSGQAGDEYMVRTAAVHTVIDRARRLSANNLLAVRKRWSEDAASLDDGFREVAEMVEETESADDVADDAMFDDGWDEIGIGKSQKMVPEELDRTKKVHGILRLMQLLHKRILRDILSTSNEPSSNTALDRLSSLSHTLLSASDELVSTLYTPQDPQNIETELRSFRTIISDFQASLIKPDALETELESLSLENENRSKWFDTCFVQIYKAVDALQEILRPI
ncbi:Grap2 and cyclin-D-interacting-domain-containing protein [Mycena maculata]|uniref:Grap2 and cyclin-D-interacting-domain-containing protein n=1 Tax=Mycena maculata TaxID=230809 RepID=A0AAD7NTM0_9AGAR|nr:Grap2 and cyclin-D-interacting-domain-containing protein [Mycena maculata]